MRRLGDHLAESGFEPADAIDEPFAFDDALDGNSRGTAGGMAGEGVAGHRPAIDGCDRVCDLFRIDCGTKRQIAAGKPLGDRHDVGLDSIVSERAPGAAAARAAHDFIGDHQDSVAIADLADER